MTIGDASGIIEESEENKVDSRSLPLLLFKVLLPTSH